jgi:NAD(P)-dependent dehydrogenase (short-subunit alcohol dehydrogenase family)
VTGASKGIGAGMATAFRHCGRARGGELFLGPAKRSRLGADVRKAADVAWLFKAAHSAFGRLGALLNLPLGKENPHEGTAGRI